jgi:CBS domain-containing protein
MTVRDVMTKQVVTCRPETNLAAASALMWENDCGVLPVLAENGAIVAILTDRDICIALGTRNARSSELAVRDVARGHTLVCQPSDDIQAALELMRSGKIRRLPVVNDDAVLEGIVSMDDVVLKSERDDGKGISYGDVVTTLQAIYSREVQVLDESAAA